MFQFKNNEFQNNNDEFKNVESVTFKFVNNENKNEIINKKFDNVKVKKFNNVKVKVIKIFKSCRFIFKRSKIIVDFNNNDFIKKTFYVQFSKILTRRFKRLTNNFSNILKVYRKK